MGIEHMQVLTRAAIYYDALAKGKKIERDFEEAAMQISSELRCMPNKDIVSLMDQKTITLEDSIKITDLLHSMYETEYQESMNRSERYFLAA